jgi:hypothetical protein
MVFGHILLGAVSVSGKRNLEARDKGAEIAPETLPAARRDFRNARKLGNCGHLSPVWEISV